MNNNKNKDVRQLTALDDNSVAQIAERYPALDSAAKKRIAASCERKMKMNNNSKKITKTDNTNASVTVKGNAERIDRIPWYRKPAFTIAASVAVVVAIGALTISALSRTPVDDNPPELHNPPVAAVSTDVGTSTVTTSTTDAVTSSENGTKTTASGEDTVVVADPDNEGGDTPAGNVHETDTPEALELITNGYNIYDYPAFVEEIKSKSAQWIGNGEDKKFALYDLNNDGTPEMLIYINGTLRYAFDLNYYDATMSVITANMSNHHKLCEGGILVLCQSDPPYMMYSFMRYNGSHTHELIECMAISGESVDSGSALIGVSDSQQIYHAVPESGTTTENGYYGDVYNEENAISASEAASVIAKYTELVPEMISLDEVE